MPRRLIGLIVILALGFLVAPLAAEAQPTGTMWRIGYLSPYHPASPIDVARFGAFRRGLLEFGYVEGQNIIIEYRSSEGKDHPFFDLAAELVRLKVDVIVRGVARQRRSRPRTSPRPSLSSLEWLPTLSARDLWQASRDRAGTSLDCPF